MVSYVVEPEAGDMYYVFDAASSMCGSIAAPKSSLADALEASFPGADAFVIVEPAIRPGTGVRQERNATKPCTTVELGDILAAIVPDGVERFAFVDAAGTRLSLITLDASRNVAHVDSARRELVSAADIEIAQAFGYDFAVFACPPPVAPGVIRMSVLSPERLHAGARAVSERKQRAHGVWLCRDDAGTTLTMALERQISFDVLQSRKPIFSLENDALQRTLEGREALLIVDENVDAMYGAAIREYAARRLRRASILSINVSEAQKTLDHARELCRVAVERTLPRDGIFVAIGGGVTLDLVGTAAAIHRRGSSFVRIATTLVGMIDVCVGVKQGVNDITGKNILGSYHIPKAGLNDASFLRTLPHPEISAGIAEILKVALVLDRRLFALLEAHVEDFFAIPFVETAAVSEIIVRAKLAMMRELQGNLWEHELRRYVDFGHTFSTAIETTSKYAVSHGLAVALDMIVSTALATNRDLCPPDVLRRLIPLYRRAGLPIVHEACRLDVLMNSIPSTRLHRAGNLNLVVPTGVGTATFVQDPTREEIEAALRSVDATLRAAALT